MALPVAPSDAARQLGLLPDAIDEELGKQIATWIADAVAWIEDYTGHILNARDVTEYFRVPPRVIELKAWPVAASAVPTITYTDDNGDAADVIGARLDTSCRPARLSMPRGEVWPLQSTDQLLKVTIRAGHETSDAVPGPIRRAMLLLIGAYDADREGGDVLTKAEATARRLCERLTLVF